MEAALVAAQDKLSPHRQVLIEIFRRLPAEDIAACRQVSTSFYRLFHDDDFLEEILEAFEGFVFPHESSGECRYFSLHTGRTTTVNRAAQGFWNVISTHDGLVLAINRGLRWRVANRLTDMTPRTAPLLWGTETLIAAVVHRLPGSVSAFTAYFLTRWSDVSTWSVLTFRTEDGAPPRASSERLLLDVERQSFLHELEPCGPRRVAVHAGQDRICVMFSSRAAVWVDCRTGENHMVELLESSSVGDGSFALFRSSQGHVYVTSASPNFLELWMLVDTDVPSFRNYGHIYWGMHFSSFPRLHVVHMEDTTVYVRIGRSNVVVLDLKDVSICREIVIGGMTEGGAGGLTWPPLLAFSPSFRGSEARLSLRGRENPSGEDPSCLMMKKNPSSTKKENPSSSSRKRKEKIHDD